MQRAAASIDISRLMTDIQRYSEHGRTASGGITRPCFSLEDFIVREMFVDELTALGLEVKIDGAANIWGRLRGSGAKTGALVVGSHLDTVPDGGAYDGALGVLMAIELVRTIQGSGLALDHDLEIVSFTGEEPNDFQVSTIGSRSFTGKLRPEDLRDVADSGGYKLGTAMAKAGGGLDAFEDMWAMRGGKAAFLELHIEQGRRLEAADTPVGLVNGIVGIYRDVVRVHGDPNHAGTTMMEDRTDALTATAELALAVEKVCGEHVGETVGTVGKLEVVPNAANIVPGLVEFVLELRGAAEETIGELRSRVDEEWARIAHRRAVRIERRNILDQKPVDLDPDVVRALEAAARDRGTPYMVMPSMAGHDASHMADIAQTAMVFVRSIGGKSHCPAEQSLAPDIEQAGNVMLEALASMDAVL